MVQDETIPNHDFKQSGLERKERDSCGKSASKGDPAGMRRGSRTARGKECLEWKSTTFSEPLLSTNYRLGLSRRFFVGYFIYQLIKVRSLRILNKLQGIKFFIVL